MDSLSWLALVIVVAAAAAAVAVGGLLVVRRRIPYGPTSRENEVAGLFFSAVGIVYGALLAFMVVAAWESFANAEEALTQEGASLVAVYRDTQMFPEPFRSQAQTEVRAYVARVLESEWAAHGHPRVHSTPDLLNPLWAIYRQVPAATPVDEARISAAEERLHELEHQRHLRHLSGASTLPPIFWPVLILGGIVTVVFSYFFYDVSVRAQAGMTGIIAAVLAALLVLIYSLNQPFTGPTPVSRQPLLHAVAQFDALDLEPAAE